MNIININVGVLGHVDSGKTSLVKALSTHLSTASLDRNPQSKERGITLDLGFSSFILNNNNNNDNENENEKNKNENINNNINNGLIQITLVDCPGHASLIRTIIGGANIIDMMILVIEALKGIQTQTIECIAIGEAMYESRKINNNNNNNNNNINNSNNKPFIIVINKIDLIPEDEREEKLNILENNIREYLIDTCFNEAPIIRLSASVGGETNISLNNRNNTIGLDLFQNIFKEKLYIPERNINNESFFISIDHCFTLKGRGTIITGTVLNGEINVGDFIEFPYLGHTKKIKSIQIFHENVNYAKKGDRVGMNIKGLDSTNIERAIASTPNTIPLINTAICLIRKVQFYNHSCPTYGRFHMVIGHQTAMANVIFFGAKEYNNNNNNNNNKFDWDQEYEFQSELYNQIECIKDDNNIEIINNPLQWVFLQFLTPIRVHPNSFIIGSKLDTDINIKQCRIAFYGKLIEYSYDNNSNINNINTNNNNNIKKNKNQKKLKNITKESLNNTNIISRLKIYVQRERIAKIKKINNKNNNKKNNNLIYNCIGTNLIKYNNLTKYLNKWIVTENNEYGKIISSYGTDGDFKINFPYGALIHKNDQIFLKWKYMIFLRNKDILQDEPNFDQYKNIEIKNVDINIDLNDNFEDDNRNNNEMKDNNNNNDNNNDNDNNNFREGEIASYKGEQSNETGKYSLVIVKDLFSIEENINNFINYKIKTELNEEGYIIGSFGKKGKCKVSFPNGTLALIGSKIIMSMDDQDN